MICLYPQNNIYRPYGSLLHDAICGRVKTHLQIYRPYGSLLHDAICGRVKTHSTNIPTLWVFIDTRLISVLQLF
jgi:hypothetical protein